MNCCFVVVVVVVVVVVAGVDVVVRCCLCLLVVGIHKKLEMLVILGVALWCCGEDACSLTKVLIWCWYRADPRQ